MFFIPRSRSSNTQKLFLSVTPTYKELHWEDAPRGYYSPSHHPDKPLGVTTAAKETWSLTVFPPTSTARYDGWSSLLSQEHCCRDWTVNWSLEWTLSAFTTLGQSPQNLNGRCSLTFLSHNTVSIRDESRPAQSTGVATEGFCPDVWWLLNNKSIYYIIINKSLYCRSWNQKVFGVFVW